MGFEFSLADIGFLTSAAGVAALSAVDGLALTPASYLADVSAARALVGSSAPAVLETVLLRRKALSKLDWLGGLFTDDALQQATHSRVAALRAGRFAGRDVHDVTCSIGADLVALARVARRCVGSDLDPVRLAMAGHNLAAAGVSAGLVRADALAPVSRDAAVLADPARRDRAGRRRWRAADLVPTLAELAAAYPGRDLAVSCAPGLDRDGVPWPDAEVELVSLDGGVRESCVWVGSLASPGVRRRATVLRSNGTQWTVTDADPDDCPVRPAGEWIVDPDGAVVRAGLVRHYAARHGLGQLDEHIAYLTGDSPPPGVRALRVLESGRYREAALRTALARLDAGAVEILVRGLDVDPNTLRPRLGLRGTRALSVVLTRIGHTPTAYLCEPPPVGG